MSAQPKSRKTGDHDYVHPSGRASQVTISVPTRRMNTRELQSRHGSKSQERNDMSTASLGRIDADVDNIKTNLAEVRADVRELKASTAEIKTDTAVISQRIAEMSDALSKRPTMDSMKVWFLTITLFSFAMPIITLLVNLYLRKG